MQSRIAIIDIGTNTFNLLMVDRQNNDYKVVHTNRVGVGLGHGGINHSTITSPAFKRGVKCLNKYAKICKQHQVDSIYAFGTSALRHAKNANDFVVSVKKNTNIDIQILNGQEEANMIYKGIKLGYDFNQKSVVMDIGGGSTEFILADHKGIIKKQSFEIGASRINQLFNIGERFTTEDILKIEQYLIHKIGNRLNDFSAHNLVGSSGSFETFYELTYQQKYPQNLFFEMGLNEIQATLNSIINSTLTERKNNPFIIPIRQEMLPIAAIKTKWVLNKLNCKKVIISPNSLKEGAIFGGKIS